MSDLRTAAKQALEALESLFNWHVDPVRGQRCSDAITVLRAALEQPEQEPVAWRFKTLVNQDFETDWALTKYEPSNSVNVVAIEPLYIHPPRREWRGLAEEEIRVLVRQTLRLVEANGGEEDVEFYRAIEAALKERNA
jgi:hypothetical protein